MLVAFLKTLVYIIYAYIIVEFICALYILPTGAMQPTLHGKRDYPHEGGDKVFVNKTRYWFSNPQRWDIIVFEYPYDILYCENCGRDVDRHFDSSTSLKDRQCQNCGSTSHLEVINKDYIKRCVGLPGESLKIFDGDVLRQNKDRWEHLPKPNDLQERLWMPVYKNTPEDLIENWKRGSHVIKGTSIALKGEREHTLTFSQKSVRARYDKGVHTNKAYYRHMAQGIASDLMITLKLRQEPQRGILELQLLRNRKLNRAIVDFSRNKYQILNDEKVLKAGKFDTTERSLSFSRLDGRLILASGNWRASCPSPGLTQKTHQHRPGIRYHGDDLLIDRLGLYHDIHYLSGAGEDQAKVFQVKEKHYFTLGDNSAFSSDSRDWGVVPVDKLIGKPVFIMLPFSRVRWIY